MPTFVAAALARLVVSHYGVKPVSAATHAAQEAIEAHWNVLVPWDRVDREYRKLDGRAAKKTKQGDKYQLASVEPGLIDDVMKRLPKSARHTGWMPSGAPLRTGVAVAHLYDPDD